MPEEMSPWEITRMYKKQAHIIRDEAYGRILEAMDNVVDISIDYQGSGDSGAIESIEAYDGNGNIMNIREDFTDPELVEELRVAQERLNALEHECKVLGGHQLWIVLPKSFYGFLTEYVYWMLRDKYPGWENNEGAEGQIMLSRDENGKGPFVGEWQHTNFYLESDITTSEMKL